MVDNQETHPFTTQHEQLDSNKLVSYYAWRIRYQAKLSMFSFFLRNIYGTIFHPCAILQQLSQGLVDMHQASRCCVSLTASFHLLNAN